MNTFRRSIALVAAVFLMLFVAGCGQEAVILPDSSRPTVTATSPLQGATGVAVNSPLTATFSKAMNSATISASTFRLAGPGGVAVTGAVSYAATGSVATFVPSTNLATSTTYTATITTGAQDTASPANSVLANYIWTFTTAPTIVPVSPTVISTTPVNGAANVPTSSGLTATFSTAMNPATINGASFLLAAPGGVSIPGTVGYAGVVAIFTPAAPLAVSTTYVATITTAAQSAAGTALASNYVWSFTTAAAPPPPVAPTVISTVPANGVTSVPLAQVLSATFSTAMSPGTINGSTFKLAGPGGTAITGSVGYAGVAATFTPAAPLTTNTTYIATITTGAQNVAGTPLAANYVWSFTTVAGPVAPVVISTVPINNATGVPLTQVLSAVFSKTMNAATLNAAFTVTGPLGVVVSGTVGYSAGTSTATFTPSGALLPSATYVATITTGAQDTTGTALAGNYVWTFRTVPAPTPPVVISTIPANNAAGVPINDIETATFSEAMNPSTINGTTFTLTAPGGVAVAGTVTYVAAGSTATFSPTSLLAASTTYVATITTGAQDLLGVPMSSNYVWTFTTGATSDTTKPTVISTIPMNGAINVPFNQAISATFSEAMDPTKFTATTFTVTGPGITPVTGLVTYAAVGNTATFTPAVSLIPGTLFTATITTGVSDVAGNNLAANYVWTFTTGAAPDTTPPTITLTSPVDGATAVPLSQTVSATFSEAMDPLTITTATFTLATGGGAGVAGTVSYNPLTFIATITPSAPLTAGTSYIATVTTGAKDLAGNSLGAGGVSNPWTFSTSAVVVPPPVNLGTASLFGGFGGAAGMTNQGTLTVVNGDIGTTAVSTLITGFHDNTPNCTYSETGSTMGLVNGSIVTSPPPPTVGCPNEGTAITAAVAAQAALDAQTAFNALAAFPNGKDVSVCPGCGGGSAGELGNRVLVAGVYKAAPGSYGITQGNLTLDAKGDPNAFWVFQMATTLTVGTPSGPFSVLLVNGAQAKNVFWQVGTAATINGIVGGGTVAGTIIAQAGISVSTVGVATITTIDGRLLVLTGPVTLVNTVINVPAP